MATSRYYCKLHGMSDTNFCLGCARAEVILHYVTPAGLQIVRNDTDDQDDPDNVNNSDVYSQIMYLEEGLVQ